MSLMKHLDISYAILKSQVNVTITVPNNLNYLKIVQVVYAVNKIKSSR